MCYKDNSKSGIAGTIIEDLNLNQTNMNSHQNYVMSDNTASEEDMAGMKFIDIDTALVDLNVTNEQYNENLSSPDTWNKETKTKKFSEVQDNCSNDYSFSPITLIDDLELWDD